MVTLFVAILLLISELLMDWLSVVFCVLISLD